MPSLTNAQNGKDDDRTARQLVFDLTRAPSYDPDEFLVTPCNEVAHAALLAWPNWPDRVLLLIGPAGAGKSHLAAIWAADSNAQILSAKPDLGIWHGEEGRAVMEDCDRLCPGEAELFHLLNLVRESGGWLLLTARRPPDRWGLSTPDLLSRLRLAPIVSIERPDAILMKAVMVKLFADRQITIDEEVVNYAARHCEQSLAAINDFVAILDHEALAHGRRITRSLANKALSKLENARSSRDDL